MTGPTESGDGDGGRRTGRRALLRSIAVAGTVGIAGCGGSGGDGTATPSEPPTRTDTATPTATATGTPTDTPTPTETETGSPTTETTTQGRPATGDLDPALEPIDAAFREFVRGRVPAAALGVARDGDVLLERGYGWADEDRTVPTPPDARFRIASNTKPFTKAAVRELIDAGDLSMDTEVFPTLGLEPLPGDDPDDRTMGITVEHLLTHRGGLGPLRSVNPMFDVDLTFEMADRMSLSAPPTTRQRARFVLGRPLQFEPGSRQSYSNFGYAVLGLLVEEVGERPFPEFARSAVLDGVAADRLYEGRTLPGDRRASEVDYHSQRRVPNVYELDRDERVPFPDGGFHLEALGGAGEFVATTRTLLSFLDEYWITGRPRSGEGGPYVYYGSLPGTFTMTYQHESGVDVVALLNYRGPTANGYARPLKRALDSGIGGVENWP
jgi:N-acyl-D-amino-acid deacylase